MQLGVVSSITLGMVLRHIIDALRKPPGSSMFVFGVDAMRQFGTSPASLSQLVPFCMQLVQVRRLEGLLCKISLCLTGLGQGG